MRITSDRESPQICLWYVQNNEGIKYLSNTAQGRSMISNLK